MGRTRDVFEARFAGASRPAFAVAVRSLASRLFVLWLLSLAASLTVGLLLVQFRAQSTAAQVGRAQATAGNACNLIRERYGFFASGWPGPVGPAAADPALRRDLTTVVAVALARQPGVEGGLWLAGSGSLAYAFPTYAGSGRKTDLPQAEQAGIADANEQAARDDLPALRRTDAGSQTLLLAACPVGGPLAGVTAWAMMRVQANTGGDRLSLGLGVLAVLVAGMSGWLTWVSRAWSRHVARIERALASHDIAALPRLAHSGERDLDRVVDALNDATARLADERRRSAAMAARVAASERLAALGRVVAGVAHEIRNPIAAMRLRAENALAGDDARRSAALPAILTQIARLDRLAAELLTMTQRREPAPAPLDLAEFLGRCADEHRDLAAAQGVHLRVVAAAASVRLDAGLIGRAVSAVLANAVQHTPRGGLVTLAGSVEAGRLRVTVADTGPGVTPALRQSLFEPFVTGRAEGTGLGLAIARELVEAHGGALTLDDAAGKPGAVFRIELEMAAPWPASS